MGEIFYYVGVVCLIPGTEVFIYWNTTWKNFNKRKKVSRKFLDTYFKICPIYDTNFSNVKIGPIIEKLRKTKKLGTMKRIIQESESAAGIIKYIYLR